MNKHAFLVLLFFGVTKPFGTPNVQLKLLENKKIYEEILKLEEMLYKLNPQNDAHSTNQNLLKDMSVSSRSPIKSVQSQSKSANMGGRLRSYLNSYYSPVEKKSGHQSPNITPKLRLYQGIGQGYNSPYFSKNNAKTLMKSSHKMIKRAEKQFRNHDYDPADAHTDVSYMKSLASSDGLDLFKKSEQNLN